MKKQWQEYSRKYLEITPREQILIMLTGLVVITLVIFHFFIDNKMVSNNVFTNEIKQLEINNRTLVLSINEYKQALKQDPNRLVREKISAFEHKLAKIDEQLLALTSELINPIQMRYALLDLLNVAKGVELLSFELIGAEPLLTVVSEQNDKSSTAQLTSTVSNGDEKIDNKAPQNIGLNLYRHGIKIKLEGDYFALQQYLHQLEQLSWKFFWQEFDFKVKDYPLNELSIEIYSLGSKKEFVGV
ncbi:hypothetical protein KO495_00285 [Colwellia sp. D2M02]|uniref:hypothetical protein n=1 Tax=Colwellia sp. D2M02 TaxID=2841562 RepID=UPI001C092A27|nr:hypothetical protein [Colwellia sp. D2M02]MBU2891754.1 hypothetical protein [Colwellia sp. D2M02]